MQESAPKMTTLGEALAAITLIEQQIRQQGAVDSEPNALENLRRALASNKISPQEAIEKANELFGSRQDYH